MWSFCYGYEREGPFSQTGAEMFTDKVLPCAQPVPNCSGKKVKINTERQVDSQ